jgi:hypothetical protein
MIEVCFFLVTLLMSCPTQTLREALGNKFLALMPPLVNFLSAWTASALIFESMLGALCVSSWAEFNRHKQSLGRECIGS